MINIGGITPAYFFLYERMENMFKRKSNRQHTKSKEVLISTDDDYVMKNLKLYKYFIVDKTSLTILDQIELTEAQARKINDNIKDIAFIRQ